MDKLVRYRQIIQDLLMPLTERSYANADLTNEAVFDEKARFNEFAALRSQRLLDGSGTGE